MNPESTSPGLIPLHGGYRKLKSFQVAQLVYDVTVAIPSPGGEGQDEGRCRKTIPSPGLGPPSPIQWARDMQAARSGVQNIAEGSQASGTSKKTELKFTNVARASLEELRLDSEDFLRQRGLPLWAREDARRAELIAQRPATVDDVAAWAREVHERHGQDGRHGHNGPGQLRQRSIESTVSTKSTYEEISANGALALIAVTCSLLNRQIAAQENAFVEESGFTERLYRVRNARRSCPP